MCISRKHLPTSKQAGGSKARKKHDILCQINYLPRLTLIFLCLLAAYGPSQLQAQSADAETRIAIPPIIQVEPASRSPIPISVIPADKTFSNTLLLIKGLPSSIALSKGRLFPSGIWALRVDEVIGLEIETPPESNSSSPIIVSLVTLEGTTLAVANANLVITEEFITEPAAIAVQNDPPSTATTAYAAAPTRSVPIEQEEPKNAPPLVFDPDDEREIELLMTKGQENLRTGNIEVARLFFTRAAEKGWAEAALAVARTYDEEELKKVTGVVGEVGDLELAREWYEKARELGSVAAVQELQKLGQR